ncbi:unannotated protein [freshwater metagenome]|uniref:Unannotated protein n=1 Tax=freshwater metagenome TaxID=449393 RepID=A0A6J7XSS6_9ZZZZ|nr:YegS/Rv2252/BmrU family lipid kinase [Actinomycetota bacterium]
MWGIAINPMSGQGKGSTIGKAVAGYFTKHDLEYQIISSSSSAKFRESLNIFVEKYPQALGVLSVGGDGLAHMVLQAVVPKSIAFGIVPAGTGNDFYRALGWKDEELETLLDSITTSPATRIDLGQVDSEWFGAILSCGFDAVVNERANSLSWPKGPSRYNVSIALELPRFTPEHFEITLDDQIISTQAMLIAVGNGSSYGGGMKVCPNAYMHDGLFDVMILKPVSKLEFLRVFPRVYAGSHIHHPQVDIYRSKRVRIEAQAVAYADGERIGQLPVDAHCVPEAGLTWTR